MQLIRLLTVVTAFALGGGIIAVGAAAIGDTSLGKEQDLAAPDTRIRQKFEEGHLRVNEHEDVAARAWPTTSILLPYHGPIHTSSVTVTQTVVITQPAGPPVLVTVTQLPGGASPTILLPDTKSTAVVVSTGIVIPQQSSMAGGLSPVACATSESGCVVCPGEAVDSRCPPAPYTTSTTTFSDNDEQPATKINVADVTMPTPMPSASPVGIGCVNNLVGHLPLRAATGDLRDNSFVCKDSTVGVIEGRLLRNDSALGYVNDKHMLVFSKSAEAKNKSVDFSVCGADQFLARNQDRQWWRCSEFAGTFAYFDAPQPALNRTCQQVVLRLVNSTEPLIARPGGSVRMASAQHTDTITNNNNELLPGAISGQQRGNEHGFIDNANMKVAESAANAIVKPFNPIMGVSQDGSCGVNLHLTCKGSGFGNCCSTHGWCGNSPAYCGHGSCDSSGAVGDCDSHVVRRRGSRSTMSYTPPAKKTTNTILTASPHPPLNTREQDETALDTLSSTRKSGPPGSNEPPATSSGLLDPDSQAYTYDPTTSTKFTHDPLPTSSVPKFTYDPLTTSPHPQRRDVAMQTSAAQSAIVKTRKMNCGYKHNGDGCWGSVFGECCDSRIGMCGSGSACSRSYCDPHYGNCYSGDHKEQHLKRTDDDVTQTEVVTVYSTTTEQPTTTTITVDYVSSNSSTFLGYFPVGTGTSTSCNSTATTSGGHKTTPNLPTHSDNSDKTPPPILATPTTTPLSSTFGGFSIGATQTVGSAAGKAVDIGGTKYVVAGAAGMVACGVLALFL